MRAFWWVVSTSGLLTVACGQTEQNGTPSGQGGAATGGGASSQGGAQRGGSGSGTGGSVILGGSVSHGGTQAAFGGAAVRGGSTSSGGASAMSGGASAVSGGASTVSGGASAVSGGKAGATGGAAGAAGDGGASSCEDFRACGCGCCGGVVSSQARCYYPEVQGDLEGLIAADEAARRSPECANAGCSAGIRYVCCEAPASDPSPATMYSANFTVGAYDRIQIVKVGTALCPRVTFLTPGNSDVLRTAMDAPPRWVLERASHVSCLSSALPESAVIGASGSIKYRASGAGCLLDMHFTVFLLVNGELTPVRFDADGVVVSNASSAQCASG